MLRSAIVWIAVLSSPAAAQDPITRISMRRTDARQLEHS
jgi:hypothetical protein